MQLHPFHPSTTYTKSIHVNLATLEFKHVKEYFSNCRSFPEIDTHGRGSGRGSGATTCRHHVDLNRNLLEINATLGQIVSQKHKSKEAARFRVRWGLFCDDPGLGKQ